MISRREALRLSISAGGAALFTSAAALSAESINDRMSGDFAPVHDPCIIKSGDTFHLFSTGHHTGGSMLIPWRTSQDLLKWTLRGAVFDAIPEWALKAVPDTKGLWAPDISFYQGRYRLYYAVSSFGSQHSVIGLATSASLDSSAKWQDEGLVFRSEVGDDFNAIDPNHIVDRDGKHWLSFGSFWSGIKLIALDPVTGKPSAAKPQVLSIASRPVPRGAPGAIEAPFIIERGGFYYQFVSFDYCCRGVASSYYLVVGRSKTIEGPYVGADGQSMMEGYGVALLQGNRRYHGPGHCAVLRESNQDYLVYHAYDAQQDGKPVLRISPIAWNSDGWPTVSL